MNICLAHGADIFRYDLLFQTIGSIIDLMIKDAPADYLLFLENAFAYIEKYNYGYGMKKIIAEMTDILRDNSLGTVNDRALLLNNKASYERSINGKSKTELLLLQEALELCVPADNIALYANINMNLGCTYLDLHDMKNAEKYMMTAIEITKQANIVSHDFIIMVHNYATLLAITFSVKFSSDENVICKIISVTAKCGIQVITGLNNSLTALFRFHS